MEQTEDQQTTQTRPERRASQRVPMVRPAKVYDPRADRFFPGRTSNISAGGALLCLRRAMPVHAGDRVDVGIAGVDKDAQPMKLADMRSARVVRVCAIDSMEQAVAVQFNQPSAVAVIPESAPSMAHHARPVRIAA